LAQLETQKATAIGGGEASAVQNAPSILANLAGQQQQAALGYLNAGTGATTNAANVFGNIYNQAQAQQAESLNMISSLAGVAGSVLTGGIGGTGLLSLFKPGAKNTTAPLSTGGGGSSGGGGGSSYSYNPTLGWGYWPTSSDGGSSGGGTSVDSSISYDGGVGAEDLTG
jgi:hypothetical protein